VSDPGPEPAFASGSGGLEPAFAFGSGGPEPASIVREDILAQHAYPVPGARGMVKLDMMENPHPLPTPLREALARRLSRVEVNRYPAPEAVEALRARIARHIGLPAGMDILLGNGSDELIRIVLHACARPGACVLTPGPGFSMYRISAGHERLRYHEVPLRADFSLDRAGMLAALAAERPAIVFLAFPNNPTGNLFLRADIEAVLDAAPGLVVIDEAYLPFARESWLPELARRPGLLVLRTLSKAGLAGLRLGYLCGAPRWISQFDKVRPPFNVNSFTLAAVDLLLDHEAALAAQADAVIAERMRLLAALRALPGARAFDSAANFLLVRVADAGAVFAKLLAGGILVKDVSAQHPLLRGCLRITVGTRDEDDRLLAVLAGALA
jgi:histidinol-phosphate aminotransferase